MTTRKRPILVVEDDLQIRELLSDLFSGEGFPVQTAQNGQDALVLLERLETLPAVIFLDLMMPVLDGQGFLIALQKQNVNPEWAKIPVVVLSAARPDLYGRVVCFVRKPPQIETLIELAEKYAAD